MGGRIVALALMGGLTSISAQAASVVLVPSKDTTIYAESGSESNGAGEHLFAGRNGSVGGGAIRRALLAFNISSIPAGSTITGVSLEMYCSKAAPGSPAQAVRLHRMTAAWGEGTSDAAFEEGSGIAAQPGDATWTTRFFGSVSPWSTLGGDHVATSSAAASVGAPGFFYTWSSAGILADVQGWFTSPLSNQGWILRGNETTSSTARRFGSRQNGFSGFAPHLTVTFNPPLTSVGETADDDPLTVAKTGTNQLELAWGASCVDSVHDYAVYQGTLGNFTSHVPIDCSTAGALSMTIAAPAGSTYWLIVPQDPAVHREGSYGQDSEGDERPPSASACFPQLVGDPVCPGF